MNLALPRLFALCWLALALAFSAEAGAQQNKHTHSHSNPTVKTNFENWQGQKVDVFGTRVIDLLGRIHRLGVTDKVAPFVLIFIDRDCPISSRYGPELNVLNAFAERAGMQFFGVISNTLITAAQAQAFVEDHGLEFPVIWDPVGDLAMRVKPLNTPEAFVISPKDEVLYRGRIDNRFATLTVRRPKITSYDLEEVITLVYGNEPVTPKRTAAVGCYFEAWDDKALPKDPTYARHVAPILNANCIECHRSEGIGPFPLESYEEVKARARMIAHVTEQRIMPPWRAQQGYGSFRDERYLSERQIGLLAAWLKGGAKQGAKDDMLARPVWPAPRWQLGKPDLVIEMDQDFHIRATGEDIYRYFVVPVELLGDRAIAAWEFRPGDAKAVHHSLVYLDYTGKARAEDRKDTSYGFSYFRRGGFFTSFNSRQAKYIGGWAPGLDPIKLPPGHAVALEGKPADAVFEIHYRPYGKITKDRSRIGLYFAKEPVTNWVAGTVAGTLDVVIKPEDRNYWRQVHMDVPRDLKLIGVSPHMHYLGREVKAVATLPDGSEVPLLYIPDWDFRWQNVYMFREPIRLPAGSRIDAWFRFDNSTKNPYNPHSPAKTIRWGWASDEEMCELWMRFVADTPKDRRSIRNAGNSSWRRLAEPSRAPPDWAPKRPINY